MPTSVFVCQTCDGGRRLLERLRRDDALAVRAVGCQKICSHHVVGARRDGALVWFRRIDSKRRRRALRAYLSGPHGRVVPKRLRRLVVATRAGRLRR